MLFCAIWNTKFLNPVRIQKLLIYQRFYFTHFLGWGTNWGSWDFCTLSPTSFTSRYLVNSQLIFHEIYIYKLYTLYPKVYAISSNILLEKFFFIKVYEVLITFRKRGFAAYGIYTAGKTFLIFLRENILIKFFHNIFTGISSCRGNFFSKTYVITLFFTFHQNCMFWYWYLPKMTIILIWIKFHMYLLREVYLHRNSVYQFSFILT